MHSFNQDSLNLIILAGIPDTIAFVGTSLTATEFGATITLR